MREKCCKTIISVLLAAVLFTGCTNSGGEPQDTSAAAESSGQATSSGDIGEGSGEPQSVTEEQQPKTPAILSNDELTSPLGSSGLRSFEIPGDFIFQMSEIKDGLIFSASYGENAVTAYQTDLSTGKISSAEVPLGEDEWSLQDSFWVVNGYPLYVELSQGIINVYDQNFIPLRTEEIGFQSYSCAIIGNSLAVSDHSDGNRIILADIGSDGTVTSRIINVNLSEGYELAQTLGAVKKGEYLISYCNKEDYGFYYGILYEESGEVIPLHVSDSKYIVTTAGKLIIIEYGSTETEIFDPEFPSVKKVLDTPAGASLIYPTGDENSLYYYSAAADETGTLKLAMYQFDAETGGLTAERETDLPFDYYYISSVYEYSDYILLEAYAEDKANFILWKPEAAPERRGYDAVSGADYTEINRSLAQKIKNKYSMEVLYGSNGVRHFNDYAVVSETDEKLINNALMQLDGFMAKFPEGFFGELISKSAGYDDMCIYLTGKIIPNLNESQSISDASAFVTTENYQQIMVLDITQSYGLEKNIAHEFMHIIENAMYCMNYDENGEWLNKELFRRWDMLNPQGFSYYFSYTDEYGSTLGYEAVEYNGAMYYDGCGIDINSIYFVDGYSMTYANEDRARIFENIATTSAEMLPAYFRGSAMQLKAAYLCACIRDSFDCITDDTVLFWENGINPEYTLEYFRENYDLDSYLAENAVG